MVEGKLLGEFKVEYEWLVKVWGLEVLVYVED